MSRPLAPTLNKIRVGYEKLILDPNNPRFTTGRQDQIPLDDILERDLSGQTKNRMDNARYKVDELKRSIVQNGSLPVDSIFVRRVPNNDDFFVVLEGNRRVCAIREIMSDKAIDDDVKHSLKQLDVMEVLPLGDEDDLRKTISYLLGVRHHGSLKRWTPFAQARNIFQHYLEQSRQSPEEFTWVIDHGQRVADILSVTTVEIKDRLRVYRVMTQIGNSDAVRGSTGGIVGRYYSVCAEPLISPRKTLASYLPQDDTSFLLTADAVDRMNNLCHFDHEGRQGAPIGNPREWRYLDKILSDEDEEKRDTNLRQVEVDKRTPSDVWAERAKELTTLTWDKWLFEVDKILQTVTLLDLSNPTEAAPVVKRLVALVDQLNGLDAQ